MKVCLSLISTRLVVEMPILGRKVVLAEPSFVSIETDLTRTNPPSEAMAARIRFLSMDSQPSAWSVFSLIFLSYYFLVHKKQHAAHGVCGVFFPLFINSAAQEGVHDSFLWGVSLHGGKG